MNDLFFKDDIDDFRQKLMGVVDIPLNYKKLCDAIGMKYVCGEAKIKQLNDLKTICFYLKQSKPTRYIVKNVYDKPYIYLKCTETDCAKRDRWYVKSLWEEYCENGKKPLFFSVPQLLEVFGIVNKNFNILRNSKHCKIVSKATGKDYKKYHSLSTIFYTKLAENVSRILNRMEDKEIITVGFGYRLLSVDDNSVAVNFKDIVPESAEYRICDEAYSTVTEKFKRILKREWFSDFEWKKINTQIVESIAQQLGLDAKHLILTRTKKISFIETPFLNYYIQASTLSDYEVVVKQTRHNISEKEYAGVHYNQTSDGMTRTDITDDVLQEFYELAFSPVPQTNLEQYLSNN